MPVCYLLVSLSLLSFCDREGGGRNFQSGNTAINSLQEWCRRRTKYHEVCGTVENLKCFMKTVLLDNNLC